MDEEEKLSKAKKMEHPNRDSPSQPKQENTAPVPQTEQENTTPDSETKENKDGLDETTDQSKSSPIEYLSIRNLGRWTVEAIIADRVVKNVDRTYITTKRFVESAISENKEYIDLSEPTDYSGTHFKISFFDGAHRMWLDELPNSEIQTALQGPPKNLAEIISQDRLPFIDVDSVHIYWAQNPIKNNLYEHRNLIYNQEYIDELNVVLPDRGVIHVTAKLDDQEATMWARFISDGEWQAQYSIKPRSEPYEWYIPVPRTAEIAGTRISWYD